MQNCSNSYKRLLWSSLRSYARSHNHKTLSHTNQRKQPTPRREQDHEVHKHLSETEAFRLMEQQDTPSTREEATQIKDQELEGDKSMFKGTV